MSEIYDNFNKIIKKYPKKKIIYNLNKTYTGKDCEDLLEKAKQFIKLNNIKTIGIKSPNNLDWIILYLASDKLCNRIYILKNNFNSKIVNKLKNKYKIDYIAKNIPKKIRKFKKNNLIRKKSSKREDVLFTSGTTDLPKGVVINKESFLHIIKILTKKFNQNKNDLELLSMPFDHSFGLVRLRCCLYKGSKMFVSNGLVNFPDIYNFSQKNKITGLSLVPSGVFVIKNLLKNKTKEFNKNLKYFEIGSSGINFETRMWLKKNFNKTNIIHHYGMTEASRSFLINRGFKDNLKISNDIIGNVIDGCKYKISNNFKGELLLKGKNLFDKYLDQDNNKKIDNKWFKTGDIVEKKNGRLKLIGRIDNQINIGGNKVQSEFIENLIESLTNVKKCLCFQVNDEIFNKRIALQIEKETDIDKKEIIISIQKLLKDYPDYYQPKEIYFKKIKFTKNGKKIRSFKKK